MFMLYEIFIWNCFAKLLYFCMNVFFIGIIRSSYLTLACFLCLICWFSSVMLHYCDFFLSSSVFRCPWEVCSLLRMNGYISAALCPPGIWTQLDEGRVWAPGVHIWHFKFITQARRIRNRNTLCSINSLLSSSKWPHLFLTCKYQHENISLKWANYIFAETGC